MAAKRFDLYIDQGADLSKLLTFQDGSGNALDLTGWAFFSEVRAAYDDPIVILEIVCTLLAQAGATLGQVTLTAAAAVTALLPVNESSGPDVTPTLYPYDLFGTDPAGKVHKILFGTVSLFPAVTQDE
jgi:hypothetical protein